MEEWEKVPGGYQFMGRKNVYFTLRIAVGTASIEVKSIGGPVRVT